MSGSQAGDNITKPDGSIDESFIVIEKQDDMYVFDAEYPRPAHAVSAGTQVRKWD